MNAVMEKERKMSGLPTQVQLLLDLHRLEKNGDCTLPTDEAERIERDLDASLRERYRKVKSKRGTGVAVLQDRVCSECRMAYPETHEILRYKNCIRTCEFCGRLLVVTGKVA